MNLLRASPPINRHSSSLPFSFFFGCRRCCWLILRSLFWFASIRYSDQVVWFGFTIEMEKKRSRDEEEDLSLLLHKQEQGGCLIQKILVWLPVVSLLRFKAVCKSWRDLIQSPSFIHLHTPITLNSSSSKFGSFIVHVKRYSESEKDAILMLSSSPYEQPISGDGDDEEVVVVDDLGFDMENKELVGSCNGLVCIHDRLLYHRNGRESNKHINIYLWNPATGLGMDVPESKTIIPGDVFSLVVFGFDVETKDYKVVRFTCQEPRGNGNGPKFCFCRVQVYSLSSHSWRLLEGIPCLPGNPFQYAKSPVYLNGTCFFLAHHFYNKRYPCIPENNRFIISFDFTKEILTPIQLPEHHGDQEFCLCSLGDDKIALFTSTTPDYSQFFTSTTPWDDDAQIWIQDFNIWVLNCERGSSSSLTKESWKKLHSFQLQLEGRWNLYIPCGISNDGKFALLISDYGGQMTLYNFATKEVKPDFLSSIQVRSKAHAYKLSLVSVIDGNGAGSSSSSSQYGD